MRRGGRRIQRDAEDRERVRLMKKMAGERMVEVREKLRENL